MRIRQSDLASYARCPQQKRLQDLQKRGELSKAPEQLSATAYGSVIHHAVRVLEELHSQGRTDALEVAQRTFEHYWEPDHIEAICPRVTIWILRDTWSGLLRKGVRILEVYYAHLRKDPGKVLAVELPFTLPYMLDGEEHELHGTIDKLTLRRSAAGSFINVEDWKSGRDYIGLRWNQQFTIYTWATRQRAFWAPWGEQADELYQRFRLLPRRGTWISLRDGVRRSDAGSRGDLDYQRMDVALREYVKANRADVFPLTLTGSVCRFCPFQEGICGGVELPPEDYGR